MVSSHKELTINSAPGIPPGVAGTTSDIDFRAAGAAGLRCKGLAEALVPTADPVALKTTLSRQSVLK